MSNEFRDRMLSVGYLSRGRTRDRVVDGRRPDGVRTKTTSNEAGTVVEHNVPGDRVDAFPLVQTVRAVRDPATGKVVNQDG